MLHHLGHTRTYQHNIRLAALLCLTAGMVNLAGLMAFATLTTNVTGHMASFADRLLLGQWHSALVIGLWMFSFLLGAFISSLIINRRVEARLSYLLPIAIETLILLGIGTYGAGYNARPITTDAMIGSLLFAMGMQNALVSVVSGSVVRTTHLTGMMTDLGIELAAVVRDRTKISIDLKQQIYLRLVIISFFFLGCIVGGVAYEHLHFYAFYLPAFILIVAQGFDIYRLKGLRWVARIKG